MDGWREAIAVIAARHGLPTEGLVRFEGGSDIVWAAGDRVIKLSDPRWGWQIEAEADWLVRVDGRIGLQTPRLLAADELEGWPYVVMTRIGGRPLGDYWPDLPREDRVRLAGDIGRFVRALHSLDVTDAPRTWAAFWADCEQRAPERDLHDPRLPEGAEHLAREVPGFLESVGPLEGAPHVALHTELIDQHLFADLRDGRVELSGVLDFADGRVGPAEYDFPAMGDFVFRGESGLLRECLQAYGYRANELTPELTRRLLAWGLTHRFGLLRRMLLALGPRRPRDLNDLAELLFGFD